MPDLPDPGTFDPAILLTAAGATVGASIIAALVEAMKKLPGVGAAIASNAASVATVASFAMVFVAYEITQTVTPVGLFAAFVASLGVAAIAGKAYDVAPDRFKVG